MKPEERIELIAKAIAEVDADDTDDSWEELNPLSQWAYRRMARAALEAAGVEDIVRRTATITFQHAQILSIKHFGDPFGMLPDRIEDVVKWVMQEE